MKENLRDIYSGVKSLVKQEDLVSHNREHMNVLIDDMTNVKKRLFANLMERTMKENTAKHNAKKVRVIYELSDDHKDML